MQVELTDEDGQLLIRLINHSTYWNVYLSEEYRDLRKKLTPKIPEPTNVGAVVCGENGAVYIRTSRSKDILSCWWGENIGWTRWGSIKNPTLIFEGVEG